MTTISWDERGMRTVDGVPDDARWRPIETMPRDGTPVLLYFDTLDFFDVGCAYVGSPMYTNYYRMKCQRSPSHWMPLPPLPNVIVTGSGATTVEK